MSFFQLHQDHVELHKDDVELHQDDVELHQNDVELHFQQHVVDQLVVVDVQLYLNLISKKKFTSERNRN